MSLRIPIYEQSSRVSGTGPIPQASGLRIVDPIGQAVGNVGSVFGQLESGLVAEETAQAHILRHQEEEDGKAYAGKALSDAHVQWQEHLQQRQESAPPGAPGFTPGVIKDFDEWSQAAIEQAPTPAAKRYLSQHLQSYRSQLAQHALTFESQARVGWRTDKFTKAVDNWAVTVAKDPGQYELATSALHETLPAVGPLQQEKLRDYLRKALVQGAAAGQVQADPEHAYNLLLRSTLPDGAGEKRDRTGTYTPLPAGVLPDWVAKIAQEEHADPRLVAAIYAQESGSGANSKTSTDGARGGFQVMPDTFKRVMKGQGNIDDPQDNARAGIRLIAQLQDKFGADPILVGAAYFSGEGNVTPHGIKNPNRTDGNGKSVKSYAADIGRKYAALDAGTRSDVLSDAGQGVMMAEVKTGVPWVDAMTLPERLHYLQAADSEVRRRQLIARSDLDLKERDQNAQALTGKPVAHPLTLPDYVHAYGQIDGQRRYSEYVDNQQFGANVQQVAAMSTADQAALLARTAPVANAPGFASDQQRHALLQKAVATVQDQRQKDPIAFAVANRTANLASINFQDPASVAGEMSRRAIVAQQNRALWGVDYRVLSDSEADQLGTYLNSLQSQEKARVLGQIYQAAGSDGLRSISGQLKDKHETLAIAGMLASRETTESRNVAQLYLEGKDALAQKRAKIDERAETGIKANIFNAIDGVYTTPQARDAAADVSYAIYAKLKSEGVDNWERATRIATGGIMNFNGGKIAKPYGWSDSQFRDVLVRQGAVQIDAAGASGLKFFAGEHEIPAAEFAKLLPGAKLQTYGDGAYLVKSGSDLVRLSNGQPFILDFSLLSILPKDRPKPSVFGGSIVSN